MYVDQLMENLMKINGHGKAISLESAIPGFHRISLNSQNKKEAIVQWPTLISLILERIVFASKLFYMNHSMHNDHILCILTAYLTFGRQ